jgi:hypothetical protein
LADEIDTDEIYAEKCALCHGEDGKGTPTGIDFGAKDFTDAEWQGTRTDDDFVNSITTVTLKTLTTYHLVICCQKKKLRRWSLVSGHSLSNHFKCFAQGLIPCAKTNSSYLVLFPPCFRLGVLPGK